MWIVCGSLWLRYTGPLMWSTGPQMWWTFTSMENIVIILWLTHIYWTMMMDIYIMDIFGDSATFYRLNAGTLNTNWVWLLIVVIRERLCLTSSIVWNWKVMWNKNNKKPSWRSSSYLLNFFRSEIDFSVSPFLCFRYDVCVLVNSWKYR